ncbi:hypothetical protein G6F31_015734 [Rhizopus arrhizus]|nr:hypothetical protein G6F31_015734 [Rhizopus arrhizus]
MRKDTRVLDAQPGHVPAAVVGVTDAEDHERSLAHRIARAPVEGESAALGEDVARRVPGQHAIVFPLDRLATYTVVDHRHLVAEVRYGLALCCRSLQAVVGIDVEEQGGSKQVGGIGGGRRGASSQRHCQQQAAKHSRAVRHGDVSFQRATAGGGPPDRSKATPRRHLAAQQWSRQTAARIDSRRRRCAEGVAHAEQELAAGFGVLQRQAAGRRRVHPLVRRFVGQRIEASMTVVPVMPW